MERVSVGDLVGRALLIKVALLAVVVAAAVHDPGESPYLGAREGDAHDIVWYLGRGYDAPAYQGLAETGYYDRFSRNYPLGFPLLVRAVDVLTGNRQTAAVLVANVSSLLAVALFIALARRYTRDRAALTLATIFFACTPGVLAFGTVAYAESTYVLVSMLGWWAYLRAEQRGHPEPDRHQAADDEPARARGWLLLAGVLFGASIMVKHLAGPVLLMLAWVEGRRVLRAAPSERARTLGDALAVGWVVLPVAWYFWWKFSAHGMADLQGDIWRMRFQFLGGVPSMLGLNDPIYITQIVVTLPLALLLTIKLRAVDGRLALLALLLLLEAYSFTGIAAQSITRYTWAIWPLSLGVLTLADRATGWALCGVMFLVSLWCALGHVLGTAAF